VQRGVWGPPITSNAAPDTKVQDGLLREIRPFAQLTASGALSVALTALMVGFARHGVRENERASRWGCWLFACEGVCVSERLVSRAPVECLSVSTMRRERGLVVNRQSIVPDSGNSPSVAGPLGISFRKDS